MKVKPFLAFWVVVCGISILNTVTIFRLQTNLKTTEFQENQAIKTNYLEEEESYSETDSDYESSEETKNPEDTICLCEEDTSSSIITERRIDSVKVATPKIIYFKEAILEPIPTEVLYEVVNKDIETVNATETKLESQENLDEDKTNVTTFKDVPVEPMPEAYIEVKRMLSTAYCHCKKCCNKDESHEAYGITYSGINLLDGNVHKVIAADIKVFPMGTKVYIEDYGIAVVGDIGGGIKGDHVDIYFPTHEEALSWKHGMQEINVYVISYPEG